MLALALLALLRQRDFVSGLWLGLSIVAVDFLSLLFMPVLFLAARRRVGWSIAFFALPILGYGLVTVLGADPLSQVVFHANYSSSGNLPYLLGALGLTVQSPNDRLIANLAAFAFLCATFVFVVRRVGVSNHANTVMLCAFVMLLTMLINKKAFTTYLIIVLFPICLVVVRQGCLSLAVIFFQALSTLATIEPSLWFRWMKEHELSVLLAQTLPDGLTRLHSALFLVTEILLVAGYIVLLALLWRDLERRRSQPRGFSLAAARRPLRRPGCRVDEGDRRS